MKVFRVGGFNPISRYQSLEAVLKQAKDDDIIELHKNITFAGKLSYNLIIEGNGHTLTVENGTVGLHSEKSIVIRNLTISMHPRANGLVMNMGGRLENVNVKIKGPARVLYPTILINGGDVLMKNCSVMRLETKENTSVQATDCIFKDYYGGVTAISTDANLSLFTGQVAMTNCDVNCCKFTGNATLTNCRIGVFNKNSGELQLSKCLIEPTINTPVVNLKKEPSDGPLEKAMENSKYALEQDQGNCTVYKYKSNIPKEFVGFHIKDGNLTIQKSENFDDSGYHIVRNGSISFIDVNDTAYYEIIDAKLSQVRSTVNTSIKSKTALEKLDELIGLEPVKKNIRSILNTITVNQRNSNKNFDFAYHMIFAGDPGTGKTTVAKIVAQALFEIGAIPENKCTVVSVDSLIKGYVGQTAEHVKNVLDDALGGVLFIDEAYELSVKENQNSFNSEALAVIIRYMEDYRDRLVVIAAGYEKEMKDFLASNAGLTRRFQWVCFPDYDSNEMTEIFELIRTSYNKKYEKEELITLLPKLFDAVTNIYKSKPMSNGRVTNGGNGGLVRNVFQQVLLAQNNRLIDFPDTTKSITEEDLKAGFRAEMEKALSL